MKVINAEESKFSLLVTDNSQPVTGKLLITKKKILSEPRSKNWWKFFLRNFSHRSPPRFKSVWVGGGGGGIPTLKKCFWKQVILGKKLCISDSVEELNKYFRKKVSQTNKKKKR